MPLDQRAQQSLDCVIHMGSVRALPGTVDQPQVDVVPGQGLLVAFLLWVVVDQPGADGHRPLGMRLRVGPVPGVDEELGELVLALGQSVLPPRVVRPLSGKLLTDSQALADVSFAILRPDSYR